MSFPWSHGMRAALLASVVSLVLTGSGRAADVTEDQAKELSGQLRGWMAGIVTDRLPLSPGLFTVRPAGANYSLTMPLPPGVLGMPDDTGNPTDAAIVALVHPESGTRWRIESLKFPSAFRLSPSSAAALGALGAIASPPGGMAIAPPPLAPRLAPVPPNTVPSAEWHTRTQTASGVFDTAQLSDSRLDFRIEGVTYDTANVGGSTASHTSVDRYSGTTTLHPTAAGGLDLGGDATIEGYKQVGSTPTFGSIRVAARRMAVRGEMGSVMTGQVATLIRTAVTYGLDAAAAQSGGDKAATANPNADRDTARTIIATLKGILDGVRLEEIVEGLDVEVAQGRGSADTVRFAFAGNAPDSKFQGFMEMGLGGVKVLGLPPQFADLVPRSFVFRPTVGNIDVKALTALAEDATQGDADPEMLKARLMGLFVSSGVRLGIEHLDIDLGFASMTASGTATMLNQHAGRGQADIVVTNLDALMVRAQTLPNGGQAIGVMAMAKGFGKAQGNKTVWHIAFSEDNKVLVNGMDVSRMGGK